MLSGRRRPTREHADERPPHALRARQRTRIGRAAVGAFLVSAPVDPLLARGRWRPASEHADGRPSHARALVPPRKRADGGTPSAQPLASSPQASRRTHNPRVRPPASYPSPRWRPAPLRGTEQMTMALSVGIWDNRGRKVAPQKTSRGVLSVLISDVKQADYSIFLTYSETHYL